MSHNLMVVGTTSDAGKTVLSTALCRALARRGYAVAPFKAQNMSNNSMVTKDGAEMGRAQWVQAIAAGVEPESAMNPVLLKPGSDRRSHVIVRGRPFGELEAADYAGGREQLADAAYAAYDELASRFDIVVCEGAGSPAEINLRDWDYVNMGLARRRGLATVLVGDIDRGGMFAAMFGTLALLERADQALVCGLVVNKFRGESDLLQPGLSQIARLTGRPVLGVLPWIPHAWLDSEDALALSDRPRNSGRSDALRIAVVAFPRISNFTDIDALCLEPDVEVEFVRRPDMLASFDVVLLPGSRATLADLRWLRERGLADAVVSHARRGGVVLGICGGMQMLGGQIEDPDGVEGELGARVPGLGLLDVRTHFTHEKTLSLSTGTGLGVEVSGYEIHHGRVTGGDAVQPFPGGARTGNVDGTMWHGSLEGDAFRRAWLTWAAEQSGGRFIPGDIGFEEARRARIETLADSAEEHLDLDEIERLATAGPPTDLPVVRGGLA